MPHQHNAAYDYSLFEAKPAQSKPDIKEVAIKRQQHRKGNALKATFSIIVAIVMVSALLYCRAIQVELDANVSSIEQQLKLAVSENITLKVELESKLSLKKIEEIATEELGLEKMDDLKIEYINFNESDKAEVIAEKGFFEKTIDAIKGFFS